MKYLKGNSYITSRQCDCQWFSRYKNDIPVQTKYSMYLPVEEREWYGRWEIPSFQTSRTGALVAGGNCTARLQYPERTSVRLEPLHGSAAPVMLDVYGRSVDQDVYSKQGSGALEPVPPMDSVDTLRDLQP